MFSYKKYHFQLMPSAAYSGEMAFLQTNVKN